MSDVHTTIYRPRQAAKADFRASEGTFYYANGNAEVGCYAGGRDVGEAAR